MGTTNTILGRKFDLEDREQLVALRKALRAALRKGLCSVKFRKADGSIRNMTCTLNAERMPTLPSSSPSVVKKVNKEVLKVWDVEADDFKGAFRSFRLDSLIKLQEYDDWLDSTRRRKNART